MLLVYINFNYSIVRCFELRLDGNMAYQLPKCINAFESVFSRQAHHIYSQQYLDEKTVLLLLLYCHNKLQMWYCWLIQRHLQWYPPYIYLDVSPTAFNKAFSQPKMGTINEFTQWRHNLNQARLASQNCLPTIVCTLQLLILFLPLVCKPTSLVFPLTWILKVGKVPRQGILCMLQKCLIAAFPFPIFSILAYKQKWIVLSAYAETHWIPVL